MGHGETDFGSFELQLHRCISCEKKRTVSMVLELLSNKQLFRTEFHQSTRKLLRVCKTFGTAPWELTLFENDGKPLNGWTLWLVRASNGLYSVFLIAVVMVAAVLQHIEFDSYYMPFMTRVLYISEYIMENGVVMLILIGCQCQRRSYEHLAQQLLAIAIDSSLCGGTVDCQRIETIFNRLLSCVMLFFAAVLMVDFLYNDQIFWSFVRSSAVYTLSNIINVLGLFQYAYALYVVFFFYHNINRLLKSYTRHLRHGQDKRYARQLVSEIVLPSGALYNYAQLIDTLRRTHLQLSKLTEQINGYFGVLIVSTATASFVVLSLQFFGIYLITTAQTWTITDTYLLVYTVLWIVLHAAKILMILYPCHLVQRERDRTGPILYRFDPTVKDSALNNALAKFSSQLLHVRGPLTACGVINLEMTLISTMVGALTTYLVILIQFESAVTQGQSAGAANGCGNGSRPA
ncbi:putative gustatory receptor 28b [Anopheles moucheti]|uniref:putative gustatory receptor 28b n=1 Tax=Anopheles moucheti TaxID=186751 RepID=UPI0022F0A220|nr:putative gustatory receptor 28b [Anopheles moucheti]